MIRSSQGTEDTIGVNKSEDSHVASSFRKPKPKEIWTCAEAFEEPSPCDGDSVANMSLLCLRAGIAAGADMMLLLMAIDKSTGSPRFSLLD